MDNNNGGKRVAAGGGMSKGAKIGIISAVAAVALLAGAYVGLCAYVSGSGRILNNTTASLGVDLSGMTRQEAVSALESANQREYVDGKTIRVTCEGAPDASVDVSGGLVQVDAEAVADAALAHGRERGFLGMGLSWITAQFGGVALNAEPQPVSDAESVFAGLADGFNAALDSSLTETDYRMTDTALILTKGTSGLSVNVADVRQKLLDAAQNGQSSVVLTPEVAPPAEPDFEAILREVAVEAADAYLDKETKEIVPSVTGVSFDTAVARQLLAETAEGEMCRVPLDLTQPKITSEKLEENLFKDVLGQSTTKAAGPNSRWFNIELASSFVNGTILLPGETFSYNEYCGPYEASTGYQKAGAYQDGKTVDTTAGGICQLSSTLYWTTLKANLETVERTKHKYNVGYLPTGMDATVYSNILDFKFKNSTDYPIKIECYLDKSHYLHVTIYGTDTTGLHGEPYAILLQTIPGKYVYEASDTIAQGAEPKKDKERTLYNGKKVEVHQKVVDADGNVVSDSVIHTDAYSSRDGVYLYNPADAALWGIDPSTGLRNLTPVTPTPSPDPNATPSPDPSASPDPNATPTPGIDAVTPTPGGESTLPTPPVTETPSTETPVPPAEATPTPSQDVPEGIPILTPPPAAATATPVPEPAPSDAPVPPDPAPDTAAPDTAAPTPDPAPTPEETPWPL